MNERDALAVCWVSILTKTRCGFGSCSLNLPSLPGASAALSAALSGSLNKDPGFAAGHLPIARLSLSEVERAMASLSDGEKTALTKMARLYARKTPYDKEDLIQEAFARVLSGRRAWTKGIGPVLFLGGVIRISAALPGNGRARGRRTRHPRRI